MISIFDNQLSGRIPETIGNLNNLISFNAAGNQLSGEIPETIGNLISLDRLWLNSNNLSGQIPETICNLTEIIWSGYFIDGEHSYINNNSLCPIYPDCIAQHIGDQNIDVCEEISIGDLNYDNNINILDVIIIVNLILNNEYNFIADINEDGFIDILDIVEMVNIIID